MMGRVMIGRCGALHLRFRVGVRKQFVNSMAGNFILWRYVYLIIFVAAFDFYSKFGISGLISAFHVALYETTFYVCLYAGVPVGKVALLKGRI